MLSHVALRPVLRVIRSAGPEQFNFEILRWRVNRRPAWRPKRSFSHCAAGFKRGAEGDYA